MDSLRGRLLIAMPTLLDPNFFRSVVAIAEHNDEGALGVILNRPSETPVVEAAPELAALVLAGEDEVVHLGGPVRPQSVSLLAELDDMELAAATVLEDVALVAADADLAQLPVVTRRVRVFAGYAGWGPGQLEAELEREDWIVEPARREDLFAAEPDSLWTDVLERKGGSYALLSRMPPDPSLN